MQWWCSWHSPEARNFRRAPLPATVWQREVGRIGPVAVPIPQHLCEELFLQSPRRTICSCSLDHAGSSVTFQQINLCIFEIKERAHKSRGVLWETEGITIFEWPHVPSRNHKDNLLLKIIMMAAATIWKLASRQARVSHWIISITQGGRSDYPIIQTRKLRFREVKAPPQAHTAGKWWKRNLNTCLSNSMSFTITFYCHLPWVPNTHHHF